MKLNLAFLTFFIILSCQKQPKADFDDCKIYNLKQPNAVWELPETLNEISGIEILNNQKVICHNDEDGNLFVYDLNNNLVEKTIPFAKKGDFEDVAINDSTAFVLRSDGTIFEVQNYLSEPKSLRHKTFLTEDDNAEGLFFEAEKNRLFVACKENSGEKNGKGNRYVYEFLRIENKLNPNPILTISQKEISETYHLKAQFSPSGIAIHPISKNIYVLSSVGKMLAEFTSEGKLQKIYNLDYSHFQQPEGISFGENVALYISNEAKKNKANILKFNYLP
jgi:DNA-binding beta-propeller fold protein YncE